MSLEPPPDSGPPDIPASALRIGAVLLVLLAVAMLLLLGQREVLGPLFGGAQNTPSNTPELATLPPFVVPPLPTPNTPELATAAPPAPEANTPEVVTAAPPEPVVPPLIVAEAPVVLAPAPAPEAPAPASVLDVPVVVAPESLLVAVNADGTITTAPAPSDEELLREIKRLQEKFDQLQETVNLVVTRMMADVQDENEQLRSELRRLQARDQAGLLANNAVPRPGNDVIAGLAEEAAANLPPEDEFEEAPLPTAEFSFNVMKEWGREPDAVAQLGGDAPTLKGVIGVVPRGSAREDLEQLGRELREQYGAYDNVNVEIFDDPVAAQTFVDTQEMDAAHRVLSVSKYAATGRDAITFFEDGAGTDLAIGAILDNAAPDDPIETTEAAPAEDPPAEAPPAPTSKKRRSSR